MKKSQWETDFRNAAENMLFLLDTGNGFHIERAIDEVCHVHHPPTGIKAQAREDIKKLARLVIKAHRTQNHDNV